MSAHPSQALLSRLGIRYPIVQGGMTFGSDAQLVAAVSNAGGLGTLGTFHYRTKERVLAEVAAIRAATERPFSVNVPFFEDNLALVEALVREAGVRILTLGGWHSPEVARLKQEHGLVLLVSVNAPTVARMVVERPHDALIVQGNESGGANSHFTTRQLFDLCRPLSAAPILLAGGLWDGADLLRALQLGAAGIQLGTRFFLCADSPLHPSIKAQLLATNSRRPLTTALAPVTDTLAMRFVQNKPLKEALRTGRVQEIFQDKAQVFALSAAFQEEQAAPLLLYAGAAVYKLARIEGAAEVVRDIVEGYRALARAELPEL